MQAFHNATREPIEFELRHARYHIPVGANVLIEDSLTWVVKARGLRLTHGPSAEKDAPTVKPERIVPHRPVLPRGVELGPLRQRAREKNEDPEVGDGRRWLVTTKARTRRTRSRRPRSSSKRRASTSTAWPAGARRGGDDRNGRYPPPLLSRTYSFRILRARM
jgi:hypothetical protein